MKISRWTVLWLGIVGVLVAVEIGVVTELITPANVIIQFFVLIIAIVIIAMLSFVGALFLGIFASHRILSGKGFTPFEQEMLRMRKEVQELRDRVEQVAARLGVTLGDRKKET